MAGIVVSPMAVNAWEKTLRKQIILGSLWVNMSNRYDETKPLPNSGDTQMPEDCIHYVSDSFTKGVQYVQLPTMSKLYGKGQGGTQRVQGEEEQPELQYFKQYYNVQRKGVTFGDESVEGDLDKFYGLIENRNVLLRDYFKELYDYNVTRSLLEGVDEYQSEAEYWKGQTITSPPVDKHLHTKILYPGATAPVVWNADNDVYTSSVVTALNTAFVDDTTKFTKSSLDKMLKYASQNTMKLSWKQKGSGQEINWMVIISEEQAEQLQADEEWQRVYEQADKRGPENRTITGIISYYKHALICTNPRQPVFNCETVGQTNGPPSNTDRFQYVKPWDEIGNVNVPKRGDNRQPIVKGGAAGSYGTCEVAMVLGKAAICGAETRELKFHTDKEDYDFSTGYEARKADGYGRIEWTQLKDDTLEPLQWGSFLYFTPTPGQSY